MFPSQSIEKQIGTLMFSHESSLYGTILLVKLMSHTVFHAFFIVSHSKHFTFVSFVAVFLGMLRMYVYGVVCAFGKECTLLWITSVARGFEIVVHTFRTWLFLKLSSSSAVALKSCLAIASIVDVYCLILSLRCCWMVGCLSAAVQWFPLLVRNLLILFYDK